MGFVIVIIIIGVVVYLYNASKNESTSSTSARTSYTSPTSSELEKQVLGYKIKSLSYKNSRTKGSLSLSADLESVKIDDIEIAVLRISASGSVRVPYNDFRTGWVVELKDYNNKSSELSGFIMCGIDGYKAKDLDVFYYISEMFNIPYQSSLVTNANVVSIPLDALVFPRKGNTTLEFKIQLRNAFFEIAENIFYLSFFNPKEGYLDNKDKKEKQYYDAIDLLEIMILIDGHVDNEEIETVRSWIEKKAPDYKKDKFHSRVNKILNNPLMDTHDELIEKAQLKALDIAKNYDLAFRYDLLEVLIKIISTDGEIDSNEKKLIYLIAENLEVNMKRFLELYNKNMPAQLVNEHISLSSFGITDDMPIDKKREILRSEYMKWSKQIISSNEEIKKRANEMLKIIAEERAKLDSQESL